jgi:hypothetical protein
MDVLPINPLTAQWMRRCPRLRAVNYFYCLDIPDGSTLLDELVRAELRGEVTAPIHSMRYRDSEVLHARIKLQPFDIERNNQITRERVLYYNGSDWLLEVLNVVKALHAPEWQDYTDFDGEVVPMSVIERMEAAEGLSEKGRKQRGVEVGAVAWGVLMDWRAGRA